MVQYAEIKEVEKQIDGLANGYAMSTDITIQLLTKYKNILEGWYGDEQYHMEKDLEL